MKKLIIVLGIIGIIGVGGFYAAKPKIIDSQASIETEKSEENQLLANEGIKNGDLIFQTSLSSQSQAIQLATNSKYSHCGIVYIENGQFYVFEAIQPVKTTPLDE